MSLIPFSENQGHFNIEDEIFKNDWSETIEGGWQESNHPARTDRKYKHSKA
jgi:hypothetical protein